ncbi:MAG: cobalamin-dependent protein [Proteobacteria bacterium]|nr:cobalamin-dependent protein [Pseudomonadota bacterium]
MHVEDAHDGAAAVTAPDPAAAPRPAVDARPAPVLALDDEFDRIVRSIEAHIVPRLVISDCVSLPACGHGAAEAEAELGVTELVALLRQGLSADRVGRVRDSVFAALGYEEACERLLAPAARRLGEMWEDDSADFAEVTIALAGLQTLARSLADRDRPATATPVEAPLALLVTAPGEQHMFGVLVVAESFRRGGWHVHSAFPRNAAELVGQVRELPSLALVGLSVARDETIPRLAPLIRELRSACRNPALRVLVGGRPFDLDPGLSAAVGGDGTAGSGPAAVAAATRLVQEARLAV